MARVAIVYYSATGTNQATAEAVAEGAKAAGAEVRVRLVAETLPHEVVAKNPAWQEFVEKNRDTPKASLDDLDWADAVVFGSGETTGSSIWARTTSTPWWATRVGTTSGS